MSPDPAVPPVRASLLVRIQTTLAVLAAATIVVCTVADVVLRYGFGRPITGAYDVVQAMLIVFVFHGMALVFDRRANITIDVIDHLLRGRGRTTLQSVSDVLQIVTLALMFAAMIIPAEQAWDYGDRMLELGLPQWVLWVVALTGILGTTVVAVARLCGTRRWTASGSDGRRVTERG